MNERFAEIFTAGGHANSLGRTNEVIEIVLRDKTRLDELYECLFEVDPWVRMRAADALEKVCRDHPDWLQPYLDKFPNEIAVSTQPSIRWHFAQIYRQVHLNQTQKHFAIGWLKGLLSERDVDWIVAVNAMDTLVQFTREGSFPKDSMVTLLVAQCQHKSKSVVRRAEKLLATLESN